MTLCDRGMLLALLPLSVGLCIFTAMFVCYTIAVLKGHLDPFFPSISDTGITRPERFIFSQLINLACVLSVVTIIIRYKIIRHKLQDDQSNKCYSTQCFTLASCCIGIVGCLGMTLVANFPDNTAVYVHFTGALMVFVMGTLYMCIDTFLTVRMHPSHYGLRMCIARALITAVAVCALTTTIIARIIFLDFRSSDGFNKDFRLHWTKGQPGHAAYLVSNFGEWILATSFNFYFFSLIPDFKNYFSHLHVRPLHGHMVDVEQEQKQSTSTPNERTPLIS